MDAAAILAADPGDLAAMTAADRLAALNVLRIQLLATNAALHAERTREIRVALPPPPAPRPKPIYPTPYNGEPDVEVISDWHKAMVKYLEYYALIGDDASDQIALFLNKKASIWWTNYRAAVAAGTIPALANNAALLPLMITQFGPRDHQSKVEDEFHYISQKTSARNYALQFKRLMIQLPPFPADEQMKRFIRGLKEDVKADVVAHNPGNFMEAERLAILYDELHFKRRGQPSNPKGKQPAFAFARPPSSAVPMDLDYLQTTSTVPQKREGGRLPKLDANEKKRLLSIGACFKCRLTGHVAAQCPSRLANPSNPAHQPSRRPLALNTTDAATSTGVATQSENSTRQ